MASTRISAPMRGVAYQLSRLSIRRGPLPARILQSSCAAHARSITTSTSSQASVSPITTSASDHVPVKPFSEQTVLATIHQFPSLEPLRFETYPANHLYLPTRKDILHRAVIYEGDMTRLGTASTKTRYEVRGSARKIRPQKGSGRARLGDKKSPMLRGGGVAFGPKPRDFATGLQKKVYDLAWRTALSHRFRKGELIIVDNAMELESPSTRLLNDIFKHHEKLRGKGRSLLVTLEERPLLEEALAEMDRAEQTLTWQEVDVKNLLELSRVIIERDALQNILLSHQEDLTHVSLQPWDKSFVRRSPPKLEEEIGWAEFRDLQLLSPKEQKEARPAAFESVASQRYAYAETLPEGPKRDDLMRSAYELIAESKQLQLEEVTGTSFAEYVQEREQNPDYLPPKIQILGVQESRLIELSGEAGQTSQLESDELDLKASRLHIQIHEIRQQAALLAAQAFEHLDVAQRLQGKTEEAQRSLEIAGAERTYVDQLATDIDATKAGILDLRIKITQQKMQIAKAEGNTMYRGNLQKKWEALVAERDAMAQAQAEALAATEALDEEQQLDEESLQDEIDDPKDPRYVPLSPPIREEMRRMQRAQRLKEEAAAAKAAAKSA